MDETRFLLLLESSRGLPVERIPEGVPDDAEQRTHAAWHSESPVHDEGWLSLRPMVARARARGARIMLTGLWSDQLLFETGYLADLFLRAAWRTVARHLDAYPRWFVGAEHAYFRSRFRRELVSYLAPDALRDVVRAFRSRRTVPQHPSLVERDWAARLKRRRRRVAHPRFGSAHARCLYEAHRAKARRLQLEMDEKLMAGCGIETATPFLDRTVIAFLMAIPGEIQNRDGVPRMILREAMRGLVPDPILGRRWRGEAAAESADDAARIGLETWRRRFFMDPDVSGKLTLPSRRC
jgi:asparagine synthase (glutamine-hydrolysing)